MVLNIFGGRKAILGGSPLSLLVLGRCRLAFEGDVRMGARPISHHSGVEPLIEIDESSHLGLKVKHHFSPFLHQDG
jgi:hypothetical protein